MSGLPNAINKLLRDLIEFGKSVEAVQVAAHADDKTPLKNGLALSAAGSSFGSQGGHDVVIFGDLNRFKALNDTHGHEAGDAAISQVGDLIQTTLVRGFQAEAYRRSGDEFVVLLRREMLASFEAVARNFGHCAFWFDGKPLSVSMSFGFAVSDGKTGWLELVKRAETACLRAKQEGDGVSVAWTEQIEKEALVNLRFRCACGVKFSLDAPPAALSPSIICPCCKKEQPPPGASPATAHQAGQGPSKPAPN